MVSDLPLCLKIISPKMGVQKISMWNRYLRQCIVKYRKLKKNCYTKYLKKKIKLVENINISDIITKSKTISHNWIFSSPIAAYNHLGSHPFILNSI